MNNINGVNAPHYDVNKLVKLGFTMKDIEAVEYVYYHTGKITMQSIQGCNVPYKYAQRLKYMYDIMTDKINVENKQELIKHLRKMNDTNKRVGIHDLPLSKLDEVPRYAVIAGIADTVYKVLNSSNYTGKDKMYNVEKVTSRIYIETDKAIVLKYGQSKKIENVLEVIEKKANGNTVIALNKDYCKLCNRYVIVASLKRPEYHIGMYEVVCIEGTTLYVYAQNIGTKSSLSYNGGTSRVYSYGYDRSEIDCKLSQIASEVINMFSCQYVEKHSAVSEFNIFDRVVKENEEVEE